MHLKKGPTLPSSGLLVDGVTPSGLRALAGPAAPLDAFCAVVGGAAADADPWVALQLGNPFSVEYVDVSGGGGPAHGYSRGDDPDWG